MSASTLERADELAALLNAVDGVRCVIEPDALNAPCVLLVPPFVRYDLGCGFSARWSAYALAPAGPAGTGNRESWAELDNMRDACVDVWPVESADLTVYVVGNTSYPAYTLTWEEAIA